MKDKEVSHSITLTSSFPSSRAITLEAYSMSLRKFLRSKIELFATHSLGGDGDLTISLAALLLRWDKTY